MSILLHNLVPTQTASTSTILRSVHDSKQLADTPQHLPSKTASVHDTDETVAPSRPRRYRRAFTTTALAVVVGVVCTTAISSDLLRTPPRSVTAIAAASIDPSATTTAIADSDVYGLAQPEVDRTMDAIRASGVRSVRLLIPWAAVEPTQNQLDWSTIDKTVNSAASRGLAVVGTVNSTPAWSVAAGGSALSGRPASPAVYGDFVAKVVSRYVGKLSAIEIWNEPNAVTFYTPKPDPAGYVDLLKASYPRIKAIDPSVVVLGGSMGAIVDYGDYAINPVRFLTEMYAAGAKNYFDALAFHPYQYTLKFSDGMTVANSPLYQLMQLRQTMIANGDQVKKIWATEYGQPSSAGGDAQQNAYVADMLTKWQELPYAGPMFIYTTRDRMTGSVAADDSFGMYRKDWTAKPVQQTIQLGATGQISKTAEYQRFSTVTDPALGTVLSPAFKATSQNWAQIRTISTIYETPAGFVTSPNPVADRARCYGVVPKSVFAHGYQDFDHRYGLRVWYSPATGAHPVGGGIANAWKPELGLAVTDEIPGLGGTRVDFEHGTITYTATTGATVAYGEHAPGKPTGASCIQGPSTPTGGGYPGADPGLASPLLSVLSLLANILGLPGRLLAPR
jgi:hypothetical protein